MSKSALVKQALGAVRDRLGEPWRTSLRTHVVHRRQGATVVALGVHHEARGELLVDAALYFDEVREVRPWAMPPKTFEGHWRWFLRGFEPTLPSTFRPAELPALVSACERVASRLEAVDSLAALWSDPELSRDCQRRGPAASEGDGAYLRLAAAIASEDVEAVAQQIRALVDLWRARGASAESFAARVQGEVWHAYRAHLVALGLTEGWCQAQASTEDRGA